MAKQDKLPDIDLASLEQVTGGVTRAAATNSSSSGDDQITTLLQGITDALKDLSSAKSGGSSFRDLMPFFLLMQGDWRTNNGGGGGGCKGGCR